MGSLLSQVNGHADNIIEENEIISNNITFLTEYLSMSHDQLNEAVSTWLANVRNVVSRGRLDPSKKDAVIKILGALAAISNEDLADALDEKGDLGTILYNAGGEDKMQSNAGLQRLMLIGREPSVKSFIQRASAAVEDPETINKFTKEIQVKIDRIMNKKLGVARKQ